MTSEQLRTLKRLLREVIDSQKACAHQHHCHDLPKLWEAEDVVIRAEQEAFVSASEKIIRGKAA